MNGRNLLLQRYGVYHHAVADEVVAVGVEYAGGDGVQHHLSGHSHTACGRHWARPESVR